MGANGQMVDVRLTARRDAKAAKAFLKKAIERVRLHRLVTIVTRQSPRLCANGTNFSAHAEILVSRRGRNSSRSCVPQRDFSSALKGLAAFLPFAKCLISLNIHVALLRQNSPFWGSENGSTIREDSHYHRCVGSSGDRSSNCVKAGDGRC